jgi:hypothetical protein
VSVTMKTYINWMSHEKSRDKTGALFERIQYSNGVWSMGEVDCVCRQTRHGLKTVIVNPHPN